MAPDAVCSLCIPATVNWGQRTGNSGLHDPMEDLMMLPMLSGQSWSFSLFCLQTLICFTKAESSYVPANTSPKQYEKFRVISTVLSQRE